MEKQTRNTNKSEMRRNNTTSQELLRFNKCRSTLQTAFCALHKVKFWAHWRIKRAAHHVTAVHCNSTSAGSCVLELVSPVEIKLCRCISQRVSCTAHCRQRVSYLPFKNDIFLLLLYSNKLMAFHDKPKNRLEYGHSRLLVSLRKSSAIRSDDLHKRTPSVTR